MEEGELLKAEPRLVDEGIEGGLRPRVIRMSAHARGAQEPTGVGVVDEERALVDVEEQDIGRFHPDPANREEFGAKIRSRRPPRLLVATEEPCRRLLEISRLRAVVPAGADDGGEMLGG